MKASPLRHLKWTALFKVLSLSSGFLTSLVLARLLPVADVGSYFLAFSSALFIALLIRLGLRQVIVRFITEVSSDVSQDPATGALLLRFLGLLTVSSVIWSVLFLGPAQELIREQAFSGNLSSAAYRYSIVWGLALAFMPAIAAMLRGVGRPALAGAVDNALAPLIALFIFAVVLILNVKINVETCLAVAAASGVMVAASSIGLLLRGFSGFRSEKDLPSLVSILKTSLPIQAMNIAGFLAINFSLWAVAARLDSNDLGAYAVAMRIYNLIAVPLVVVSMAFEPQLAKLARAQEIDRATLLARQGTGLAFFATALLSVVVFIFGRDLLSLLYGSEYTVAFTPLCVLLIGNIVNVWTGPTNAMLIVSGQQNLVAIAQVSCATLSCALCVILVESFGLIGVAMAVATSGAVFNLAMLRAVRRRTRVDTSFDFATLRVMISSSLVEARNWRAP